MLHRRTAQLTNDSAEMFWCNCVDVYVSFVCVSRFKNELTLIVWYYFVILVYLLWDHPLLPNWSCGRFLQLLRPHTWLSRCLRLNIFQSAEQQRSDQVLVSRTKTVAMAIVCRGWGSSLPVCHVPVTL